MASKGDHAIADDQLKTLEASDADGAVDEILSPLRRRQVDRIEADLHAISGNDSH